MFGLLLLLGIGPIPVVECDPKPQPAKKTAIDFSSPESVYEVYRRATKEKNWDARFAVLSPWQKDWELARLMFAGAMGDKSGEFNKLVEKHIDDRKLERISKRLRKRKLSDMQIARLTGSCITDKRKLYVGSLRILSKRKVDLGTWGKLRKLERTGSTARGVVDLTTYSTVRTKEPGKKGVTKTTKNVTKLDVYFIKTDGKWYYATKDEWKQRQPKKPKKKGDFPR